MKYKVLKDYPTTDGVLYEKEIVKVWDAKTTDGNLIVKDSDANTSILEPGLGVQGGSAVTTYANPGALPFSPISSAGSLAYTTSTGALYMSNGSGWYKITMINTAPSITLSSTTASPTKTALTLDFTYTVTEPEGTPTSITLANSGIATTGNVAITHTTSNNHVRLVFDGTTEYAGDATVTLTVTDGVNTGTGTITIDTSYYESTNTRYNSLVLKAKTNFLLWYKILKLCYRKFEKPYDNKHF